MAFVPLSTVIHALNSKPEIVDSINITNIVAFVQLAHHLKDKIALHVPHGVYRPPCRLPSYLHCIFVQALRLTDEIVIHLWDTLQDSIWNENLGRNDLPTEISQRLDELGKRTERVSQRVATMMFHPPVSSCTKCDRPFKYTSISRYEVAYFSLRCGSRLGYVSSFMCPHCSIRFYPNYYTQDGLRHYYTDEVPPAIQIEDHAFVSSDLCELFTLCMLFAWVSSQNCSHIFNNGLSQSSLSELDRPSKLVMSSDQVWRAFVYHALLRESSKSHVPLVLHNIGTNRRNDQRLQEAMEQRNDEYVLHGQPEHMHACRVCENLLPGNGYMGLRSFRAVVTDGITLGRPCCKEHNCPNPLPTNRAMYCEAHQHRNKFCVVTDCSNVAEKGWKTCTKADHRKLEEHRAEQNKSMFKLRRLLQRAGHSAASLSDSMASTDTQIEDVETVIDPSHKSDDGNVKPKARFGRRRTHNEQLVVACCGVITGRATMFGAEAISGVKDFFKSLYPTPADLPDVIFYDNNCQLQAHLAKQKDTYFKGIILPVDVFHFKSKHKITDEF